MDDTTAWAILFATLSVALVLIAMLVGRVWRVLWGVNYEAAAHTVGAIMGASRRRSAAIRQAFRSGRGH